MRIAEKLNCPNCKNERAYYKLVEEENRAKLIRYECSKCHFIELPKPEPEIQKDNLYIESVVSSDLEEIQTEPEKPVKAKSKKAK